MSIKLKHSGGNSVSLNPPTSAPTSSEVAFKLPNADGSSGQVLKTDGSGNLSWVTPSAGLFSSYALLSDVKSQGTDGGTFTANQWQVRDLNTEVDPDGIVTLSNNIFVLTAGTYFIRFGASGRKCDKHKTVLYKESGTQTILAHGSSEDANSSDNTQSRSVGVYRGTIAANTNLQIRHRCTTSRSNDGLGHQQGSGNEVYTIVEIFKEA